MMAPAQPEPVLSIADFIATATDKIIRTLEAWPVSLHHNPNPPTDQTLNNFPAQQHRTLLAKYELRFISHGHDLTLSVTLHRAGRERAGWRQVLQGYPGVVTAVVTVVLALSMMLVMVLFSRFLIYVMS